MFEKFQQLLRDVVAMKIPDVHVTTGEVPRVRKHSGDLERIEAFWVTSREEVEEIIRGILVTEEAFLAFEKNKEFDFSYAFESSRFRVNIFHEVDGPGIALRYIPKEIPTPEDLSIPASVMALLERDKGLVLVTGPTGSGKSTTLAAMIEHINSNHKLHIITIEDPIEFNFDSKECLIHQREVGAHTESFARAIKSALREDPDVIMVGEMRDPETMAAALTLAETGHLVISTLHTNDTVQSIDRIIDSFPPTQQAQVRIQLAMALTGVVSQKLVPRASGSGRSVAREVLINNDAVRSVIMRGATHQLYSIIELSSKDGMSLMDHSLQDLFKRKIISQEVFESRLRDKSLITL